MLCRANFSTQRPHGRAAISAALRMLCRANSSTHRPPGRTLHKKRMPHLRVTSFFLFSYSSARCRHGVREGGPARAGCPTGCRPDALPCRFQRPVPISTAALPGLPVLAAGSARADGHTCCPPNALPRRFQRPVPISTAALPGLPVLAAGSARADGHTCCRPNTLPRRFQRPVPTSTAALPGLPVLAVRPRGRARFFLFAAARRCAGCLSWCAAPAFCSRRPCCRSAGQRALLRSGCRSGTACRAAPSCRQRTAG